MNKVILMGRLTKDPDVRENVCRFSIAVDKKFKKDDERTDFFNIVAFGKQAEFAGKWLKQGVKIVMEGRIENNNYTNKDGKKVYQDQIIAESFEFAESKKSAAENHEAKLKEEGFMKVPADLQDEDLPFN